MEFTFDGPPSVTQTRCSQCDKGHESVIGFVLRDDSKYAVYWVAWYPHEREAWVDLTMGSWQEPDYPDNVTFGCRIGKVEGQEEPACSLVQAAETRPDSPLLGLKLDRDSALAHPWLGSFWNVLDWLIMNDPTLNEHIYNDR